MTADQKIVKNKLGLFKLAEKLGNVPEACKGNCNASVRCLSKSH